jgi:hypothetical protein
LGDELPKNILIEFREMPRIWSPLVDWFGDGVAEGNQIKQSEAEELFEILYHSMPASVLGLLRDIMVQRLKHV